MGSPAILVVHITPAWKLLNDERGKQTLGMSNQIIKE
jgi:hypothetical protein